MDGIIKIGNLLLSTRGVSVHELEQNLARVARLNSETAKSIVAFFCARRHFIKTLNGFEGSIGGTRSDGPNN